MSLTDDINTLSDRIMALEQENERLNTFITLIANDVEWWENKDRTPERMKAVLTAYREIRPKGEE